MSDTVVTSKGQITIPKQIRERKRIAAGTRLEVTEQGEDIVLRRSRRGRKARGKDAEFETYLDRVRGSMKIDMSTDEFMELLRGE
jgi:antitoxin PrlF